MKYISLEFAQRNNLKKIYGIVEEDMSKVILMLERLKEKNVQYYSIDLILFDELNHTARIEVSCWSD
jgi:uncharacterized tellurite resistance protein B-like protein